MADTTHDWFTVGDVARTLGVAPETVRLWERLGEIKAQRTASGVRLFTRDAVERMRSARTASAPKRRPLSKAAYEEASRLSHDLTRLIGAAQRHPELLELIDPLLEVKQVAARMVIAGEC